MVCCLNRDCKTPQNPDGLEFCLSCGTTLVPSLKNRYRIIRPLSILGGNQTFLAEDEQQLDKLCVIQQLALSVQDLNVKQQVQHLQQIGEHPQIPTVYAYFEQDNYLYLVQQLIPGQTLQQELEQQGGFSEQKIWDVLSDLLPLLYFIHKHQVVHRNVKPENIIHPQNNSKLVLINFDIGQKLRNPELTDYSFNNAFPDEDFHHLGLTCLHLLTAVNPFQLQLEHNYSWITFWQQYLETQSISQELENVIDKLLHKTQYSYQLPSVAAPDPPQQQIIPLPATKTIPSQIVVRQATIPVPYSEPPSHLTTKRVNKLQVALVGAVLLLLGLESLEFLKFAQFPDPAEYLADYVYPRFVNIATLTGHTGEVNTVAFTPNNQIATGSDDKTIKIWNLKTFQEIRTLKGHLNWIYSVAISPDGQTLVSGSKDNTVKVWNLNTGQELSTLTGHTSYINSVAISPDDEKIASASYDKTVRIWNLSTAKISTLKGHTGEVLTVAISRNQKLVSGSTDQTIKVWNLNTGKLIRTLEGHTADVNSVAISPDRQQLVSVSDDKTIKLWNLNTGKLIRTLKGHTADVNFVAISPDGKQIATGSDDKTIKIWNPIAGTEVATLKGHTGAIWAVAFSLDGKTLVSASEDKTIKIWRVSN